MRLISCHIDNYGKLSDFDISFDEKLNVVSRENGFGKSTLASFLKAMFYGFSGKKQSVLENERKHYKPWKGEQFGGSLVFEAEGNKYRITRHFGSKEGEDEFELRNEDTGLVSERFSDRIGEELFGLDKESFERTVFISQSDVVIAGATDSISAKMGNLVESGNDLENCSAACSKITTVMNRLTPKRATGELSKIKAEISGLEREVLSGEVIPESYERIREGLLSKNAELEDCKKKQKDISKRIEAATEYREYRNRREKYTELLDKREKAKEKYENSRVYFKGDLPTKDELNCLSDKMENVQILDGKVKGNALLLEDEVKLDKYDGLFSGGVPGEEDFLKFRVLEKEKEKLLEEKKNSSLSESDAQKLAGLRNKFGDEHFPKASVLAAQENFRQAVSCKEKVRKLEEEIAEGERGISEKESRVPKAGFHPLFIAALLFLAGGIYTFIIWKEKKELSLPDEKMYLYLTIALFVLLIICLITAVIRSYGKRAARLAAYKDIDRDREEILKKREELSLEKENLDKAEGKVKAVFDKYGVTYYEENADLVLTDLFDAAYAYEDLRGKDERVRETGSEDRIREIDKEITLFLSKYGEEGSTQLIGIERIGEKVKDYERLKDRRCVYMGFKDRLEAEKEAVVKELLRLGFSPEDGRDKVKNGIFVLEKLEDTDKEIKAFDDEISKFAAENEVEFLMSIEIPEEIEDTVILGNEYSNLDERAKEISDDIRIYDRQFKDYEENLENWENARADLERLKEEEKEKTEYYNLLDKTKNFLEGARENLIKRYKDPLTNSFMKYYSQITGAEDKFSIDINAKVSPEEAGKPRDEAYFSRGYRDLIGFCMRIALADAMYSEEKPFLVLDDPFVNLDDERNSKAKELLSKLCDEYQILLLTCHRY